MRYRYFYQSKENKSCEGWIDAHDRNDAYNQLRKQGIKPYKLLGRNPLAWKRWAAIGVLGAATAVLAVTSAMMFTMPVAFVAGVTEALGTLWATKWTTTFVTARETAWGAPSLRSVDAQSFVHP